jgi:hypothetical protein
VTLMVSESSDGMALETGTVMVKPQRPRDRDRGAVTMLATVLFGFGVLLPSAALVVDVGSLYVESQELQGGADSAAMAVAQACQAGKCAVSTDIPKQITAARSYASANAKDGHTAVTEVCGRWGSLPACSTKTSYANTCVGAVPTGNYVEVRVATETADGKTILPPVFARTMSGNASYTGTTVGSCSRVSAADVCVTAAKDTYTHTFNGSTGKATITADKPLCKGEDQPFSLVSYTAPSAVFALPQYVYDSQTTSITSTTRSLTFQVDVPNCYTQVDFVFGATVYNPLVAASYGDTKVGSPGAPGNRSVGPSAWYNGGTKTCAPAPAVAFTSMCDGTMQVQFSNGSGANIDAVFILTVGGTPQLVRLAKGTSQTVKILAGSTSNVQVEDSLTNVSTGNWKKKGCK